MKIEVWESSDSVSVVCEGDPNSKNIIDKDSVLIRTIEDKDWESCMIQHHKLMGWESYKPF